MDKNEAIKVINNIMEKNLCDYCLKNFDDLEKIQKFIESQQKKIDKQEAEISNYKYGCV